MLSFNSDAAERIRSGESGEKVGLLCKTVCALAWAGGGDGGWWESWLAPNEDV